MAYVHTQRPASQGPRITGGEFSAYNVVAEFPDLKSARAAIDALSRGTIEADNISLLGPAPPMRRSLVISAPGPAPGRSRARWPELSPDCLSVGSPAAFSEQT